MTDYAKRPEITVETMVSPSNAYERSQVLDATDSSFEIWEFESRD
jgi:hypothetical protein